MVFAEVQGATVSALIALYKNSKVKSQKSKEGHNTQPLLIFDFLLLNLSKLEVL